MAPRRKPRLEDWCLPVVHGFMTDLIDKHVKTAEFEEDDAIVTDALRTLINQVPLQFHNEIAHVHLRKLKQALGEEDGPCYYYSTDEEDWEEDSDEDYDEDYDEDSDEDSDDYSKDDEDYNKGSDNDSENDNLAVAASALEHEDETISKEISSFCPFFSILDFLKVTTMDLDDYPVHMSNRLISSLNEMTSLEVFSCKEYQDIDFKMLNRKLIRSYPALSNLTSFTTRKVCSNEGLSAICLNCPALRIIDVECNNLSDICIESLITCKNLQKVNLDRNFISPKGYAKLLNETVSSNLFKISGPKFSGLKAVLDELEGLKSVSTFQIQHLTCDDINSKYFDKVVKYFRSLTKVVFSYLDKTPPKFDLSVLSELNHLEEVGFILCSLRDTRKILSIGSLITEIEFGTSCNESKEDFFSTLKNISELCRLLKKLAIKQSGEVSGSHMPKIKFATNAFENLTELYWWQPSLVYAQHILYHATSIQTIQFSGNSRPLLSDEFFRSVFKRNPLNELKTLMINKSNTLSLNMIKYIIVNCEQLASLTIHSEALDEDLDDLQNFIDKNNYAIKIAIAEDKWVRETF